jgi:2-dehydropantoate 2-reductase
MHNQVTIGIMGAGSIGCLLATYLYRAKQPVILLLKNKQALRQYHKQGGLRIKEKNRDIVLPIPAVTIKSFSRVSIIFVCLKAYAIKQALTKIPAKQLATLQFCFFNNGLGIQEQIASIIHADQCLYMSHYLAATRIAPFSIMIRNISPIWLAQIGQKKITPYAKIIIKKLTQAKFSVHWDTHIEQRIWKKFAVNCVINPLTTLLNCRNGFLISQPQLEPLLAKICNEITCVAQYEGIKLSTHELMRLIKTVARATKNNYSSMLQDQKANRKTEINYLNGYLVRTAKKWGVAVPYNQRITTLIKQKKSST